MKTPFISYQPPPLPPPPPSSPFFFSNFAQPPPTIFFCLLHQISCDFLLHDIMDLQMLSLGTLVPQGPCGVFYATKRQFTEV